MTTSNLHDHSLYSRRRHGGPFAGLSATSALSRDDIAFTWGHARQWACPDLDTERADSYATWYCREYVPTAENMSDLPAHPNAWARFVSEVAA
jgi:hypothetical protein